jgi:hypothetical protein
MQKLETIHRRGDESMKKEDYIIYFTVLVLVPGTMHLLVLRSIIRALDKSAVPTVLQ